MKKITLALVVALTSIAASAQDFYSFTNFQEPYTDLVNPISLNNNEVWDWDYLGEFPMPFPFKVRGQEIDRFVFDDDYVALLEPGVEYTEDFIGAYYFYSSNIFLQDRTFNSGVSSSPIGYKVEGAVNNRILKIEVKNATLEAPEDYGYADDFFYVSFQIWFYEADNAIEIRYGANNFTDLDNITDGDGLYVAFGDDALFSVVSGDAAAPDYGEFTEDNAGEISPLNSYPTSGTVYRFAAEEEAGLPGLALNTTTLYPNPATSIISIKTGSTPVSHYDVYDVTGKRILEQNISDATDFSINVENLTAGIYFIAVNGQHLKFVKN